MKKLLLSLLLSASCLMAIAQESVTIPEAYQGKTFYRIKNKIVAGNSLYDTNPQFVSDAELYDILPFESFSDYMKGKNYYRIGNQVKNIGWAVFGCGLGWTSLMFMSYEFYYWGSFTKDPFTIVGVCTILEGIELFTIGYIYRHHGIKKLNQIAECCNQGDQTKITLQFSPSLLMPPQQQGTAALGLTMRVCF